jgi:hypothetical protein
MKLLLVLPVSSREPEISYLHIQTRMSLFITIISQVTKALVSNRYVCILYEHT